MSRINVRVVLKHDVIDGIPSSDDIEADMDRRSHNVLMRQRALVPVKTGFLRSTLKVRKESNGRRLIGSFGCDYAADVELGRQSSSGRWIPGQPYIRPSLDAARY